MYIHHFKHIHMVPVVVAFGAISCIMLLAAFATNQFNAIEAENTDLTGSAEVVEDIAANDGSFIQFDEGSQGNGSSDGDGGTAATDGTSGDATGGGSGETTGSSSGESSSTGGVASTGSSAATGGSSTGGDSGSSTGGSSGESSTGGTTGDTTGGDTTGGGSTGGGRVLVWSDEFNGALSSTYWRVEHSTYGDGNNELQCYTPGQVAVSGGKLILTAIEQSTTCPNGSTRTVTSGMVRSQNVVFEPGMSMEWSAKLTPADDANQGGLWPALWASGWAGGGWPTGGEWDGFEVMTAVDPTRTVYSLHWRNSAGNYQKTSTPIYSARNFSDNTHTFKFVYGIDGTLVWSRDGFETKRVTTLDTLQGYPAPFDQDMREIKINLALGGNPGPLDTRALPATLEIGYIRIYRD